MKPLVAALVLVAAALGTPAAQAVPIVLHTSLTGAAESPATGSPGTGTATVSFDIVSQVLHVQLTFAGLMGNTTAAHIHCCTGLAGAGNAGVATMTPTFAGFPLGVTSGSYDQIFDMTLPSNWNAAFVTANGGTVAGAEAALVSGLTTGKAYLNIHTSSFAGGEIRGFLVPEPGSLGLAAVAALALAGVGLTRRRA